MTCRYAIDNCSKSLIGRSIRILVLVDENPDVLWLMRLLYFSHSIFEFRALRHRNRKKCLIFHSDRGVQYASNSFSEKLKDYKMIQSMSLKGNYRGNAPAEYFFLNIKMKDKPHPAGTDKPLPSAIKIRSGRNKEKKGAPLQGTPYAQSIFPCSAGTGKKH